MDCHRYQNWGTRREFLSRTGLGLGAAALSQLMAPAASAAGGLPGLPHFAPKAKRVIYLFQSGGPPHLELFDPKPLLSDRFDEELPASVRGTQRITGMVSGQARLALQPSKYPFQQCGKSGQWLSDLLDLSLHVDEEGCIFVSSR
jgi:hypothetical protein